METCEVTIIIIYEPKDKEKLHRIISEHINQLHLKTPINCLVKESSIMFES